MSTGRRTLASIVFGLLFIVFLMDLIYFSKTKSEYYEISKYIPISSIIVDSLLIFISLIGFYLVLNNSNEIAVMSLIIASIGLFILNKSICYCIILSKNYTAFRTEILSSTILGFICVALSFISLFIVPSESDDNNFTKGVLCFALLTGGVSLIPTLIEQFSLASSLVTFLTLSTILLLLAALLSIAFVLFVDDD